MIADYERYHGIVLRELIVRAPGPLVVEPCDDTGRVNSFLLNGTAALHIKHSGKRLPPWQFTFNQENLTEVEALMSRHASFWLTLVCGLDGVVVLSATEFKVLTTVEDEVARFVRVDRDRNTMYRVYGNTGRLPSAKPRGVAAVVAELAQSRAVISG